MGSSQSLSRSGAPAAPLQHLTKCRPTRRGRSTARVAAGPQHQQQRVAQVLAAVTVGVEGRRRRVAGAECRRRVVDGKVDQRYEATSSGQSSPRSLAAGSTSAITPLTRSTVTFKFSARHGGGVASVVRGRADQKTSEAPSAPACRTVTVTTAGRSERRW
jgi:hypothetical protein